MSRDGAGPRGSPFHEPWWLEALAPGAWGAATIEERGQTVACLPYRIRHRARLTVLDQPSLTPALGPWLAPIPGGESRRLSTEMRLLGRLIEALPSFDLFVQNFSPSSGSWLPFHWAGFDATVRYTYRLEDISDPETVWRGFTSSVRNHIRTAERGLAVRSDLPRSVVSDLYVRTLARQRSPIPASARMLTLFSECESRGAGRPYFAVDAENRVHAAAYIVWDDRSAYYLIGARDERFAERGAMSLLIWEAIRQASTVTRAFDFEGSMIEPIERYFRSFGGRQTPYLRVSKASRRARGLLAARTLVRSLLPNPQADAVT